LGAAHAGTKHFWRQRVTAVALVPLSLWFVYSCVALIGAERQNALAFLKMPVNAILLGLFVVTAAIHMALGLQMVIEDYIHREGSKIALLLLNQFFACAVAVTCLFALAKIVF